MGDYFADLDSLLTESLSEKEARKAAKASTPAQPSPGRRRTKPIDPTKPANASWMNAKDVAEYQHQVKVAEAKGLWKSQAAVAMFATQLCLSCGKQHTHFEGFFLQQTHSQGVHAERWIRATDTPSMSGLPRHRKTTLHEADACADCIASQGFLEPSPTPSEPSYATWTPTKNRQVYSAELEYAGGFSRTRETPSVE